MGMGFAIQFGGWNYMSQAFGVLQIVGANKQGWTVASGSQSYGEWELNGSRVVPTAPVNRPRAWGALAYCYLGAPAS